MERIQLIVDPYDRKTGLKKATKTVAHEIIALEGVNALWAWHEDTPLETKLTVMSDVNYILKDMMTRVKMIVASLNEQSAKAANEAAEKNEVSDEDRGAWWLR